MRLVVAEGSAVLRSGLAQVLDGQGHQVVAAVPHARQLPELVAAHRPDVLLLNAVLAPARPDGGLRAALAAVRLAPGTGVLMFAAAPRIRDAAALFAGADNGAGYVLQERVSDTAELLDSLARVAAGQTVLDPSVAGALAPATSPRERHDTLGGLTPAEAGVLGLMAQGCSNQAIAEQLRVSEGTVEKRIATVYTKLGIAADGGRHNRRVLAVLRFLAQQQPAPTPYPHQRQPEPRRRPGPPTGPVPVRVGSRSCGNR
ncbi:response regulator transcription factor [Streptacidiphilus sp. PB12-B1b]|uniref:LuxR C-terminal-related transcriptional regulator n=1 Tax=Streptacidiphilus sp. PB12-B1b TaxID=2705012 RepID=UPI0015FAAD25|nr:response regulator transcription factor [Streptacidiphilus sp. PB12-B1b]QMU77959.1 response regulator transcription factor [Streptacidiphilus sp. PB12-B1b]